MKVGQFSTELLENQA